jgi:hypothetical protein
MKRAQRVAGQRLIGDENIGRRRSAEIIRPRTEAEAIAVERGGQAFLQIGVFDRDQQFDRTRSLMAAEGIAKTVSLRHALNLEEWQPAPAVL